RLPGTWGSRDALGDMACKCRQLPAGPPEQYTTSDHDSSKRKQQRRIGREDCDATVSPNAFGRGCTSQPVADRANSRSDLSRKYGDAIFSFWKYTHTRSSAA
ncbi:hypothetical protein V498_06675, partial [Pseudogymnoascus sp. VKM F-4517 (FW-2822)]